MWISDQTSEMSSRIRTRLPRTISPGIARHWYLDEVRRVCVAQHRGHFPPIAGEGVNRILGDL